MCRALKPFSGLGETKHKLLSERIFSLGFRATGKGKIFLYSTAPKTGTGIQPSSYLMGYRVLFQGVKREERETNHSAPSSAKVKNG
jgi:hypothetical protein